MTREERILTLAPMGVGGFLAWITAGLLCRHPQAFPALAGLGSDALAFWIFALWALLAGVAALAGDFPMSRSLKAHALIALPMLALLAEPWALALRLPAPHDLPERKIQLLVAAAAVLVLLGHAAYTAWMARQRMLSGRGRCLAWALPLFWFNLLALWGTPWNMTGDAPHYLLMAHSLAADSDLDLTNDYRDGAAAAFYTRMPLLPQQAGVGGRIYSEHKPLLPLLMAPAYALGRAAGAVALLCLFSALAAWATWRLALASGATPEGAWWAWAALVLTPPLWTQGGMLLTEGPAAFYLAAGLLCLQARPGWAALAGGALALFLLPWLNARFYFVAAPLALAFAWRLRGRPFRAALPGLALALSLLAQAMYHRAYFGGYSPAQAYEAQGSLPVFGSLFSLAHLRHAGLGLLWDQEFGILVWSPLWVLALWGLGRAAWRSAAGAAAALVFVAYYAVLSVWFAWTGQIAPDRFFTALTPVLGLGLAWAAPGLGRPLRAMWVALGGISLALAWGLAAFPWLAFNRAQGACWPCALLGGRPGLAWLCAWPSLVTAGPRDLALALALSAALAALYWKFTRTAREVR